MGFGNPYGDEWSTAIAEKWVSEMDTLGVKIIALSDTIGIANPESISYLFNSLIPRFPHIEFGAHLHTTPATWREKIDAAYSSGCSRFDGAIKGFGGCPMAEDELVGNIATENIVQWAGNKNIPLQLNTEAFNEAWMMAAEIFAP